MIVKKGWEKYNLYQTDGVFVCNFEMGSVCEEPLSLDNQITSDRLWPNYTRKLTPCWDLFEAIHFKSKAGTLTNKKTKTG